MGQWNVSRRSYYTPEKHPVAENTQCIKAKRGEHEEVKQYHKLKASSIQWKLL